MKTTVCIYCCKPFIRQPMVSVPGRYDTKLYAHNACMKKYDPKMAFAYHITTRGDRRKALKKTKHEQIQH